ncbi:MAG: hypothetical protein R3318_03205 [Gammaproteobacteria bacterium]|nr:hypothetical protein [Gammaproteobacteria bacterium]
MTINYRFLVLGIFLGSGFAVHAESAGSDLDETCKNHSIEVIKGIYDDVLPDMSQDQIRAALSIANQSCHKHFAAISTAATAAKESTGAVEEEKTTGDDWFTEYVLHGDPHEKEGVKRLKNRRR